MAKIYVIVEHFGQYDDYSMTVLSATHDENRAKQEVERLTRETPKPQYDCLSFDYEEIEILE